MRAAHALLRRHTGNEGSQLSSAIRAFSQVATEPQAATSSSPAALNALRDRLQTGPDLGDFIRGEDLADYSVYAPKPKVRIGTTFFGLKFVEN